MALREKKSTSQRHIEMVEREPKRKIFIVCEGDKTEVIYFQGLKDNSKELGINNVLIVLEKDEVSRGTSDPEGLVRLVEEKRRNLETANNCDNETYDCNRDKFLIVFDRDKDYNQDVSKQNEGNKKYLEFIKEHKNEYILGVTNPCFELWLLLHIEDAFEDIIKPNYNEILENKKISNRHTYISKILSDKLHMNSKKSMKFSKFKGELRCAIEQEKNLTQDLEKLDNEIGSNIGKIIITEFMK